MGLKPWERAGMKKKKKKEKIPHMCESIGHRPLWGRCPKGDEALRMGRGGLTDGWMNGRTDGRTDSPCVLQDFVPFGAAALLPLNFNHR